MTRFHPSSVDRYESRAVGHWRVRRDLQGRRHAHRHDSRAEDASPACSPTRSFSRYHGSEVASRLDIPASSRGVDRVRAVPSLSRSRVYFNIEGVLSPLFAPGPPTGVFFPEGGGGGS